MRKPMRRYRRRRRNRASRPLKVAAIAVSVLALSVTALPALLFVGVFCLPLLPFVLPFLFYEGEQELMEDLAHEPPSHLRWVGPMPHPEVI